MSLTSTMLNSRKVSPGLSRRSAQVLRNVSVGVLLTLVLANHTVSSTLRGDRALLEALLAQEAPAAGLCAVGIEPRAAATTLDDLGRELRDDLEGVERPRDRVRVLNQFLFERLEIRATGDIHDPCALLLTGILATRQGYCVGLASLALVLSERAGLPLFAVTTPAHVFLRYDDGVVRINLDPTRSGAEISDQDYIATERIASISVAKGVFMRSLAPSEFLAQVHNNLGVIYSERSDFPAAAHEYDAALALLPKFPAAFYNLGNDLLRSGEYPKAARVFTRSIKLNPNDAWALNNRGQAYRKLGDLKKARRDFEAALRLDPAFAPARANLDALNAGAPPLLPDSPDLH